MRELGHSFHAMDLSSQSSRSGPLGREVHDQRHPPPGGEAGPRYAGPPPPVAPLDTNAEPMFPDAARAQQQTSRRRPRPTSSSVQQHQPLSTPSSVNSRESPVPADLHRYSGREPPVRSERLGATSERRDVWGSDGGRRREYDDFQQREQAYARPPPPPSPIRTPLSPSSRQSSYSEYDDRREAAYARPPSPMSTPSPSLSHRHTGRKRMDEYSPDYCCDPSEHDLDDYRDSRPRSRPQHREQGSRRSSLDDFRDMDHYGDEYSHGGGGGARERMTPLRGRESPALFSERRSEPPMQPRGRYSDQYQDGPSSSAYERSQYESPRSPSSLRRRRPSQQQPSAFFDHHQASIDGDDGYYTRRRRQHPPEPSYRDGDESYRDSSQQKSFRSSPPDRLGGHFSEFDSCGGGSDRGSICSSEMDSVDLPPIRPERRQTSTTQTRRSRLSNTGQRGQDYCEFEYSRDGSEHDCHPDLSHRRQHQMGGAGGKPVLSPRARSMLSESPKSRRVRAPRHPSEHGEIESGMSTSYERPPRKPVLKSPRNRLDYDRHVPSSGSACYEIEVDSRHQRPNSPQRSPPPNDARQVSFSPSTELPDEEDSYQYRKSALRTPTKTVSPSLRSPPDFVPNTKRTVEAHRIQEESEARLQILNEIRQAMEMRDSARDRPDGIFWERQINALNETLKKFDGSKASRPDGGYERVSDARDEVGLERGTSSARHSEISSQNELYEPSHESRHDDHIETVRVRAPSDLPEGYKFTANMNGNRIRGTVPRGGVLKGEVFTVQTEPNAEF